VTAANIATFQWTLPNVITTAVRRNIYVRDFAFPYLKVRMASSGANDEYTVTCKLMKVMIGDSRQI
jgi:hypothetical protein